MWRTVILRVYKRVPRVLLLRLLMLWLLVRVQV
jgi:hypothetical protein